MSCDRQPRNLMCVSLPTDRNRERERERERDRERGLWMKRERGIEKDKR